MSTNLRPQERPDIATELLESISPGLTSDALRETARTAESIDTVRFAFNPWVPIANIYLSGFGLGIQLPVFKRMELIPLKTWKSPVIEPRTSGSFAIGAVTSAGAFPASAVGGAVSHRLQYPAESAEKLISSYGTGSTNDIGVVMLDSLTSTTDAEKLEAALLFRAVMQTSLEGAPRGADTILEDLPKFLIGVAPKLLKQFVVEGAQLANQTIKASRLAEAKGQAMIESLQKSAAAARVRALDEGSGILPTTKRDLIAASKGMKDVKVLADKLDEWLLLQYPSFSLDTDVERATRANASVTDAIRSSGEESNSVLRELLELQRQTLDQLAKERELNQQLMAERAPSPAGPQPPTA